MSEFTKDRKREDGLNCYCRKCIKEKARTYREKPGVKERQNQYSKELYRKSRKGDYLTRKYGMTMEDYNEMFDAQEGCCYICGKHQSELKRTLHVDHNHDTGEVRKLLCSKCNLLLGNADDSIDYLLACIEYLREMS